MKVVFAVNAVVEDSMFSRTFLSVACSAYVNHSSLYIGNMFDGCAAWIEASCVTFCVIFVPCIAAI